VSKAAETVLRSFVAAAALVLSCAAHAQSACSFSAQDMVFGDYDPSTRAPLNSVAEITIDCSRPTSVTLLIAPGGGTGRVADRRMLHRTRPGEALGYNLFQDASRTVVWGNGASGAALTLRVERRSVARVYGQVYAGQEPWVGSYADSVSVTILP